MLTHLSAQTRMVTVYPLQIMQGKFLIKFTQHQSRHNQTVAAVYIYCIIPNPEGLCQLPWCTNSLANYCPKEAQADAPLISLCKISTLLFKKYLVLFKSKVLSVHI